MQNFTFHNPTRIVFGENQISQLTKLVPADARILFTYGGGSIKKNGVYDQVVDALKDRPLFEFGGIEPNPRYETLMRAAATVKENHLDFLLAVGGGSVIDGTKFIAAAVEFDGEPWDILAKHAPVTSALPLGCVLTLPATGTLTLTFSQYLAHGSNATNADFLRVSVVGATTSVVFQQLGSATDVDGAWSTASASLNAFAGQTVRLLIEAADAGSASLVEAGVDDVRITQQ